MIESGTPVKWDGGSGVVIAIDNRGYLVRSDEIVAIHPTHTEHRLVRVINPKAA